MWWARGQVSLHPTGSLRESPRAPTPLSCLQRSISQPLALFLHLEGNERLTVYWLPSQTDDTQVLRVCICRVLFTCQGVPQCLPHVSISSCPCLCAWHAKQAGCTTDSTLGADHCKRPELGLTGPSLTPAPGLSPTRLNRALTPSICFHP